MNSITSFAPQQPTDVVGQTTRFVRELIGSGRLRDRERLPSTASLAKSWGIPVGSAQAALAELTKDGLIVRQPGKGTFVHRRKPALTAFAIYELADSLANPESSIHRVIIAELQRQLTADGIQAQVVVDPRRGEELAAPWDPLVQLSREHRVGATIAASTTQYSLPWLSRQPHLAGFVGDDRIAGSVTTDFNQLTDICLQGLAEQGCRSVALLCGLRADARMADGSLHPQATFFGWFTDRAADLGLTVRNEWMMTGSTVGIPAGKFQQYGYDRFRELWQQAVRPDGLMIYPDSFVPGVLLAMAELGVRAPDDLRLAYHCNEQSPIFSPFSATEAILSEREIATALIAQARRLWHDEPCKSVHVGFRRKDKP